MSGTDLTAIAADVLVVLGLLVVTLGVVGLWRMPDVYTQLHAAGKAVFLGIIAFLVASLATRDADIAAKAALIAVFLILTTPVAAHVIARAAYLRKEGMATPGAVDESGMDLPAREEGSPHDHPGPPAPRAAAERDGRAPDDRA